MVKRKFAMLMLAGISTLAMLGDARAQHAYTGVDGCAVLAKLVYAELTGDAWYGPGRRQQAPYGRQASRVAICMHTTQTVSEAFTAAMNAIGADVRWGNPSVEPGDFCLSGFLEQCYPGRYPQHVGGRWQAVKTTIVQAMPLGTASDQSVFSTDAMQLALRSALAGEDSPR